MVIPTTHLFDGWRLNVEAGGYNHLPTVLESRVSWSAESCVDHPESARGSFVVNAPLRVAELLDFKTGGRLMAYVNTWGIDNLGVAARKNVAYMEGYIDSIERRNAFHHTFIENQTDRMPFHAVPYQYRMLFDPISEGVGVQMWEAAGHVGSIQYGFSWQGAFNGKRVGFSNYSGSEKTISFEARFRATSGYHSHSLYGSSGFYDPAKNYTVKVTERYERYFADAPVVVDSVGPVVSGSIVASFTVTIPDRGRLEVIPCLAGDGFHGVQFTFTSSDELAKLARIYVGDVPWAVDGAFGRLFKLEQLASQRGATVTVGAYDPFTGYEATGALELWAQLVKPMDVDNRSLLELYQRTVASIGRVALGLSNRVGMSWKLQPSRKMERIGSGQIAIVDNLGAYSTLSARDIEDQSFARTIDHIANRITVKYTKPDTVNTPPDPNGMEATETERNDSSAMRFGEMGRVFDTDAWWSGNAADPKFPVLWDRAQRMMQAQSEPRWRFDEWVTVLPSSLGGIQGLAELIDNRTRFGQLVKILDAPEGLDQYQRVCGTEFGFSSADGQWQLRLKLEPSDHSGPHAASFKDLQTRSELVLGAGMNIRLYDARDLAV